jgi:hypothetical protein
MARYAISTNTAGTPQAMSTSYKTLIALTAATGATTLRQAFVYDAMMGVYDTPADNVMSWKIDRQTSVGTGTAAAGAPLMANDAAGLITETVNFTIEGIVTAATQLMEIPVNSRASYRWVAAPGGELVVPATDVTGLGLRAKSAAYTGTGQQATVHYWE